METSTITRFVVQRKSNGQFLSRDPWVTIHYLNRHWIAAEWTHNLCDTLQFVTEQACKNTSVWYITGTVANESERSIRIIPVEISIKLDQQ